MLVTPWLLARFGYRATSAWSIALLMVGGMLRRVAAALSSCCCSRAWPRAWQRASLQPIPAVVILLCVSPE